MMLIRKMKGGGGALPYNNERQKCLSCSRMDLSAEGLLPKRSLHLSDRKG